MAAAASESALSLASLPGPPPTPTSLLDLPKPWLLKLAMCHAFDGDSTALLVLFRTCSFFRDAVLRHRTAIASFDVPIAAEDFPAEVERLCAVARRSSSVRLHLTGQQDDSTRPALGWTETEPHVTHLLVCAMAQLEGEQPLACIKEIQLIDLEQSALVPAWVKVLCPNATRLDLDHDTFTPDMLRQPRPHPHLQHLDWQRAWFPEDDPPMAEHVRQQLAALPSLTSLTVVDVRWAFQEEEDEQQARRVISSTVTRLECVGEEQVDSWLALQRLPAQFPNLRELRALITFSVDDDGLEALLRLPHLERLHVCGFCLQRSHTHKTLAWAEVKVGELDVGSFGRLPLDSIPACSGWEVVRPSADAAAVARVAQAVRRWGGPGPDVERLDIHGEDVTALLATLGPLLAALPAEQQRRVSIRDLRDATLRQVQQLGQQLLPGVATLTLLHVSLSPDVWAALLPSLPASVEELRLWHGYDYITEQQVLALCQTAVRPIRVVVPVYHAGPRLTMEDLQRVHNLLLGPRWQPGLVTLVAEHA